ncbi:SDR family oxidoreductase [Herbaspirillum sp.]|uniref:SDR family oxidoreductase n=1 Tax=Herbaspirillum sp. TaxID=1890675 RepID=UPI001B019CC0|nr:SDR family oxidoreductase [Herbaspirillum sp.]MBO9537895.1 SDR family oxidoreductase [Herbaspirillum sp.]
MTKRPCLVIGASGNIGEEIALHLAAQGRTLALVHSAKSSCSERIPPNGENIRWYGVDVCDSNGVTQLIKTIEHDFGTPPDLVYCAGIVKDGAIPLISDETWQSVIQTNLTGAFHCVRAVARSLMVVGNGRIVFIGSVSATKGNPGQLSYAAAKGGMESMCRVIAVELGRFGITCNVVSPGAIESRMVRDTPMPAIERLLKNTPLRQFGQPTDVAGLVTFLLGEDGRHITGQVIQVDGGMTAL